jgi:hypothetical protein
LLRCRLEKNLPLLILRPTRLLPTRPLLIAASLLLLNAAVTCCALSDTTRTARVAPALAARRDLLMRRVALEERRLRMRRALVISKWAACVSHREKHKSRRRQ